MAKIEEDVFVAYGWTDLNPKYEFRPFSGGSVNDPWRWALSDQTLSEVIRRLTELNRQRYEEEVAQGLHGKKKPAAKSRAPKAGQKQSALDLGDLPNF